MSNVAYRRGIEDSFEESNDSSSCLGLTTIFLLGVCFVLGTCSGIYLIMTEDIFRQGQIFTIVPNNEWNFEKSQQYLRLPAKKIFIAATNASNCFGQDNNCPRIFKKVTKDKLKMLYNFLVNKDGVILEGLGWYHPCQQSPNCDDSSISFAFMGEFADDNCPKSSAVQAVKNFIESSQADSKINKCFMTTVDVNYDQSSNLCLLQVASNVQEVTKKYGC